MRKIIPYFLCFSLCLSSFAPVYVRAEEPLVEEDVQTPVEEVPQEEVQQEESKPEPQKEEKESTPKEEPKEEIIREISSNKDNISFGTITEGDSVEPKSFSIKNKGNQTIKITWSQTDPDNAFKVDALSDNEIAPNNSFDFQVALKNGLSKGDYSCTFTVQDTEDSSSQATVSFSVKIKEKQEEKEEPKPEPKKEEPKKEETNPQTPKVPQDTSVTIQAKCKPSEAGYISGNGTFKKGSNTVLTVYKNDGYTFDGWYKNGKKVSKNTNLSLKNIKKDASYTAKFLSNDYKISVKSNNEKFGKVSGKGWYAKGKSATIKAQPADGYLFIGWYENEKLVSEDKNYKVKDIKKNHVFKAVFRAEEHKVELNVYPKDAGTVKGNGLYEDNADVTIEAQAKKGYVFKAFVLNNETLTVKNKYKLKKVDRDLSITAYFEKDNGKTYSIVSGVANKGGVISPSGKLNVSEHANMTYNISPKNGYSIQEVSVDGKKVGPVKHYTFNDVTKNHTISVAFAPKKGNVNNVKKDKIITTKEAKKYAVTELLPATSKDEKRSSTVITPDMYKKMKEEGTLEEALLLPEQNIVGMDETVKDSVDEYNYDEAKGLYQLLDINPDKAEELINSNEDEEILKTAYENGYLDVIIDNQYLIPGKEKEVNDIFEDNQTIKNTLEFISGVLTKEEKLGMFENKKMAVSFGVSSAEDMEEKDKKALDAYGAKIDEYFYMTVMKQQDGKDAVMVTQLQKPIEVTLKLPENSKDNCILHLHNGKVTALKDIDNNKDTITIRTDSFSPYAFANQSQTNSTMILVIILAVLALGGSAVVIKKKEKK